MEPLTDQQKQIVADNMSLARIVAYKAHKRTPRVTYCEALCSSGFGLMKAVQKHDPAKGKLTTIADDKCYWQIVDDLRDMRHGSRRHPVDVLQEFPKGDDRNGLGVTHGAFSRVDDADEIEHLLATFTSEERLILRLYFMESMTMKAVGQVIGLSESAICLHLKRLVRLLRQLGKRYAEAAA